MELNSKTLKNIYFKKENKVSGIKQFEDGLYIFAGLSDEKLNRIINISSIKEFKNGEIIIKETENSDGLAYIILDGSVNVLKNSEVVQVLNKGNIFGEFALISNEKRSATIISNGDTYCLAINKECLDILIETDHIIYDIILSRFGDK